MEAPKTIDGVEFYLGMTLWQASVREGSLYDLLVHKESEIVSDFNERFIEKPTNPDDYCLVLFEGVWFVSRVGTYGAIEERTRIDEYFSSRDATIQGLIEWEEKRIADHQKNIETLKGMLVEA